MMHGHEKSDSAIVAVKPTNKADSAAEQSAAEQTAAEPAERRTETKRNVGQQSTCGTQGRISVSQALERIRRVAKERKKEKFTSLLHHVSTDLLGGAFFQLKEDAAPGIDGLTWTEYEQNLERNLEDLHARVHRGAYRALPSRRTYIPKPDGRQRPLAIAALEDKIVQRAVAAVLNAIYEADFLGFSYGFRPGRSTHDALNALCVGIERKKVNWILDADIRSFFDEISQEWLIRFLEHRVGDRRIVHLIRKWLKAGILEDGIVSVSDRGTGQGSVISPFLANVYLHYVLDLWSERWRRREATGDVIIVRYADDFIVGFQYERDARRFLDEMRARLQGFALSLHPEKTRRDRMRAKLRMVKVEMWRRMHQSIPDQGKWLGHVVRGYYNYYAVPMNFRSLAVFRTEIAKRWRRVLSRRSEWADLNWARMNQLIDEWLPRPRILHPWPSLRLAVTNSR